MQEKVMFIVVAAIVAVLCVFAWHTEGQLTELWQTPATVSAPAQHIVQLPEDGSEYYTTLFVHADWRARPLERNLVAWFEVEPRLVSLKSQTHYNLMTAEDERYEADFSGDVPATQFPALLVQSSSGEVILKASGENMLGSANELGGKVSRIFPIFKRPIFPRPCPKPAPEPEPAPAPDPIPIPDMNAEPIPDTPMPKDDLPWGLAVIAGLVVAGISAFVSFRQRVPSL